MYGVGEGAQESGNDRNIDQWRSWWRWLVKVAVTVAVAVAETKIVV